VKLGDRTVEPLAPGGGACAITVDVEDWFHANWRSAAPVEPARLPRRVEAGVERVLEMLAAAGARGTFFVLGCVAVDHPGLVRRIAEAGHEVGCHGMTHALVHAQTPAAFASAIAEARQRLADGSGQPVLGFRAPSWSITRESLWAFDALAAAGFRYSSSVFPAATYLYGIAGAPRAPYRVPTRDGGAIVEVPPPVLTVAGRALGVGGGFYLRLLPLWVHRRVLRAYARAGMPFLAYVHPREVDPGAWKLGLPLGLGERLIRDAGIRATPRRLARLLAGEHWEPLADILRARGALA
jgi:polysaccharide deacetylase family protein (PEP-CTERM system associated)